uniref:Suppressor protein SRP40-like n=1 Tax=Saccoglossus kowalevskii TaxID=10224 RepID=A0ABM0MNW3_SACKO|nr:PREDICTED: suppressor protein SRP40-like [Saccoglossus kowalevskii]
MFSRKGSNGDEMPKVNGNKKGTNNLRQISEDGNTASSSKRGSTSAPSSKRDSSSLSSFRVEADIHNESTDESVHQSQPTTPRVGFADRTLVIHESGSEDGSPRISRKSKKENSSFFRRKVGILKSYSPTSSPVVAKKSTGAKSRRRRKMGHTSPEPPSLEEVSSRFQNCDDNTPKEIYMLPSSEREYPNGGITGSETSTEESTSSSRKTSSETQASSRIEDLHEAIDEKDQDDATRHLANAGKSIEILLQQYNENKDNVNYKMTELNADSNVCVVELVKTVEEESRHSHVRRQRSLSDSDIPVQRLFTKTKTGTFRMDFYFRHKSDNYGIPKIRQNSFTRRHSEQSFPNTEIKSDPVWQLRPSKRVVMFNHHNNHQPVYKTTSSMTNISTTI